MTTSTVCPRCGAALPPSGRESALEGLCPHCLLQSNSQRSHPAEPAPDQDQDLAAIRASFPQLEIQGVLGRGGMGVVYRARHPRLDRLMALKVLAPECASDPAFAQRFLTEARAMAKLNHPNIVQVYDFGQEQERLYLLMELVEGLSLRQLMRSGDLAPEQALSIVSSICLGLQYAHESGVVHRDIKPENILINRRGEVKILDFGLAKLAQGEQGSRLFRTRASQVMGTPQYMAPEQVNRPLTVDHRADIYSLGVVFYELLTGELPVGAFELPSVRSGVDARVDSVVQRALEREPERRYQAAEEVRTDVEDIANAASPAPQDQDSPRGKDVPPPLPDLHTDTGRDDVDPAWDRSYSPLLVGSLALAAAWCWIAVLGWQFTLAWRSGETRALGQIQLGLAVAFPLASLAASAGRAMAQSATSVVITTIATLMQVTVLLAVGSGGPFENPLDLCLEIVAALVLYAAYRVLERWTQRGDAIWAITFATLVISATIAHASWSDSAPGRDAYFFASGMVALLGLASIVTLLPYARALTPKQRLLAPFLRAFGLALVAAAFYFERQIF